MRNLVIAGSMLLIVVISVVIARFVIAKKFKQPYVKIYEDSEDVGVWEVEHWPSTYEPSRKYSIVYQIRKTFTQTGSFSWSIKSDTLSKELIGVKK